MKEFLFIFRSDAFTRESRPSPEQLQAMTKPWQDWLGGIAARNKLSSRGNRLHPEGKVVKSKQVVTDGPYVEMKETLGGYSVVFADSLGEATEMAKDCPIFQVGGTVEVREIAAMD
jgi:hypothetical protein